MKRFYFTTESKDGEIYEHCGNIRGARTAAKKIANEYGETVYINAADSEEIVDSIESDIVKVTTVQNSRITENISSSVTEIKQKKTKVQKAAERILKSAYKEPYNYAFDMGNHQIVVDGFRAVRFMEKMPFDVPCDKIMRQQEDLKRGVENIFKPYHNKAQQRYKLVEISSPDLKELKEYIKEKKAAKEKDVLWSFGDDWQKVNAKLLVDIIGCFYGNFKAYTFDVREENRNQKAQAVYFCSDNGETEAVLMPVVR